MASAEGFHVAAYVYLWWGGDVGQRVRAAIDNYGPSIERLCLDCEDDGSGLPGIPPGTTSMHSLLSQPTDVQELIRARRDWLAWQPQTDGTLYGASSLMFTRLGIVEQILDAVDACQSAGMDYGLYSAAWWWKPATGDYQGFAAEPWWVADYDGVPDLAVFRPFGGIERLVAKQYRGSHQVCGITVDANVALI